MKKLLYCATALAMMSFPACQQEDIELAKQGTTVNFSVELPGEIGTKAVADGNNVAELHYAIYKYDVDEPLQENAVQNTDSEPLAIGRDDKSSDRHFNVTFDLLADQNYVVIFWAQVADKGYYELGDLRSISMTPASSTKGNEEDRAAFFRTYEFNTTEVEDHTVMLYRPFAQLNLGTTKASLQPQQEGQKESYIIDAVSSEVRVTGLATTFNTIADLASEEYCGKAESVYPEKFTFQMHDVITKGSIKDEQTMAREYLSVKDNNGVEEAYEWISMNYFFATDECNVTVEYDIVTDKGTVSNTINNVPVKENFRTNIIGNLLTSKNDFEIVVDERFVNPLTGQLNPDQNVYVVNVADAQEIQQALETTPDKGELALVLADGEYTLPAISGKDVTFKGSESTVVTVDQPNMSGSNVTFDGVTVKGSGYSTGVQYVNVATYRNATIIGEMCLYGEKNIFEGCTFELNNQYIWVYASKEAEFKGCTFNTNGKAILVYNEGTGPSTVTVTDCTFNATAGAKAGAIANQNCAAIEIDNFQSSGVGAAHEVVTSGNRFADYFSGEWRIKNFVPGNAITVNGASYTQIAVDGKLMTIDADKNVTVLQ